MPGLMEKLDALATDSLPQLRQEWVRICKSEAPNLSRDLLRLALGHHLQARSQGALKSRDVRILRDVAAGARNSGALKLTPGTRLVRSWNGRTLSVLVVEDGFTLDGRQYRSLSHIAREVTGVAWSGPRFFGLIKRPVRTTQGEDRGE